MISNKMILANTLTELDNSLPKGMSDCYKFGMAWGCREDCPQLERGECEIYSDIEDFLNEKK